LKKYSIRKQFLQQKKFKLIFGEVYTSPKNNKKGVIILKKMFDFRVVGICLVAHFLLVWFSNAEFLTEAIHRINSQKEYWIYQLFLLCFIIVYFVMLIIISIVLKKSFKLSRNRYLVLATSVILPIPFTISSGTFSSKVMSVTNTVGKWWGIKLYRYFIYVFCIWIILSVIFFAVNLIRKSLKKRRKANEIL
jgi:hypothetical protein